MIMSGCRNHAVANASKIAGSMAISKSKQAGKKKAGRKTASKKGAASKQGGPNKAAQQKTAQPKTAQQKTTKRKAAGPKAAGPKAAAPKAAKPKTAKAKTAKPLSAREKLIAVKPSGGKEDSFFDLVHEVARQIPKGRVTSYGAIAAALGTRGSSRMVGWAMMAVPYANRPVPAHRVVNRSGLLTGRHHYNPPEKMQQLLEKEGVQVIDNKVVDFKKLFWDPSQEL
jgi:methylated-DNA-protein-cysteine methyltransferase related protein